MKRAMTDEEFYRRCAEILGTTYDCEPFAHDWRTRWNNRKAGSGRFPGHGIIRLFGDQVQIALRSPVPIQTSIEGREVALEYLQQAMANATSKEDDQ